MSLLINAIWAVDPISIGLGVAGLASTLAPAALALGNRPKSPPSPMIPPTPAPVQQPQGSPTTNAQTGQPSFLAAAAAPQAQQLTGGKTLLGQ